MILLGTSIVAMIVTKCFLSLILFDIMQQNTIVMVFSK